MSARVLERPVFERLLFAQCWEDPRLDEASLNPKPGQTILSITSGGCNTLSLALSGAHRVVSIDLNGAQSALLELKIAGARRLSHPEYLELLGVRPSRRRAQLYVRVEPMLSPRAGAYWSRHVRLTEAGVLGAGRYERYLGAFRRLLTLLEGGSRVRRLFESRTPEEQKHFYETEWDTPLWRLFFRVFFSRRVLGFGGLDPSFFTYVDGVPDFGAHFLERARRALVEIPVRENYFLAQICLGRYLDETSLPPYLRAENFEAVREAASRVEVVTGELGSFLAGQSDDTFDAFNLSNVFEWVPEETFERMLLEIHRVGRPGAKLCYRNLLVRRRHPDRLGHLFRPDDELANRLLREDRSFVYANFEVAQIVKPSRNGGTS